MIERLDLVHIMVEVMEAITRITVAGDSDGKVSVAGHLRSIPCGTAARQPAETDSL